MNVSQSFDAVKLAANVRAGDRSALATSLNLLDDQRPAARDQAAQLLAQLLAQQLAQPLAQQQSSGVIQTNRLIGITGPPGVGKSSLTAVLITAWRQRNLRVGILAVDPSSPISGGALLGDRLRMKSSSDDDGVFIRSLSNRGEFGGISAVVWPMSLIMLAAFDVVLIETVGVGQRETDIANMCDTTCYVAQPGSGDGVQVLKAGILEVPHIVVVNKSDMGAAATRTLAELEAALSKEHADGQWQVPVLSTSATQGNGIEALADALEQHHQLLVANAALAPRRRRYQAHWIVKRLETEFGSSGIQRLGGEEQLLIDMQLQDVPLFQQYEAQRQQLITS